LRIAIVGGSVAGLSAALALSRDGHAVTLLERDATPFPADPVEAFARWDRRGAPQVRHSHAFLARLRNLLRDRAPDLLAALVAAGADELGIGQLLTPEIDDPSPRPGDEELVLLACRRITFEWVLHKTVLDEGAVSLRDGCQVVGLLADGAAGHGRPRVVGLHLRGPNGREEALAADLVVDASGRRSKLGAWLGALGAGRVREESEPCGIFYCSRFYRLRPGASPPRPDPVIGADLGYLKYGVFLGDGGIFSLTLAASPEDAPLRALLRTRPFEAAARAIPATEPWIADELAEPITPAHGMSNLRNTRRHFSAEGLPLAEGVVAIGDAAIHTNPLYGRGCTFAAVHAYLLADALREHPTSLLDFAQSFEEATSREIVPWYELAVTQDRDAIEVARAVREGGTPGGDAQAAAGTVNPRAYFRDLFRRGLLPALRQDATVLRAFLRAVHLLDPPGHLLQQPDVLARVLAIYQRRHERDEPSLGPDRRAMLQVLAESERGALPPALG
jgi:2-polyprenyl-6-methoxyphenol hydroxylase-like FAD-dependent oxidoreductase